MSEAVEYRIKRTRGKLTIAFAMVIDLLAMCLYGIAVILAELGNMLGAYIVGGLCVIAFFASISMLIKTRGQSERGYCRVFWEWWTSEYPDPPLDEWEQDLEERGEFEVTNHE